LKTSDIWEVSRNKAVKDAEALEELVMKIRANCYHVSTA
jgi:hypothetical protein